MTADPSLLRPLVLRCEDDLREVVARRAEARERLVGLFNAYKTAGRLDASFDDFAEGHLRQVATHTVLSLVFVRWLEDHGHLRQRFLAGEGAAADEVDAAYARYFAAHPVHGDDDYLAHVFDTLAAGPLGALFSRERNLLWDVPVSADCARALLDAFRRVGDDGRLALRFGTPDGNTRLLGDLYQDLSEAARSKYALLQTPDFVEAFLLDRTLEPAVRERGADAVTMIDPTCGSGHLVLGAAERLYRHKRAARPAASTTTLVREVLGQVAGVDLNPFAALITRFRLLVWALRREAGADATVELLPDLSLPIACADALLVGADAQGSLEFVADSGAADGGHDASAGRFVLPEAFARVEDGARALALLRARYDVVVGNPPYITVADKALNETIRRVYARTCKGAYSLVAPFIERFWALARPEQGTVPAGRVAMIVSNAFLKREFGAKVIEEFLTTVDLTHVIDTSGAYIPGHGTPTIILMGRAGGPRADAVRAVLGIRGEPGTPAEPAQGVVWRSIVGGVGHAGFENDYVSVADFPRSQFATHPWSLRGGGAIELLSLLQRVAAGALSDAIAEIGRTTVCGQDDAYLVEPRSEARTRAYGLLVPLVTGESVRDFRVDTSTCAIYPYGTLGGEPVPLEQLPVFERFWPCRTVLAARTIFGRTLAEQGREWFEHLEHYRQRLRTPLTITFPFVATHNHFVLDRGGKVFNRTAPVIKLADDATEDDHLALVGCLNASVACFWMKMVFFDKGNGGIGGGIGDEGWEPRFEFDSTKLARFPLPAERPLAIAKRLDGLAALRAANGPDAVAGRAAPTAAALDAARAAEADALAQMIAWQEELDWRCYGLYGLLPDAASLVAPDDAPPPPLALGERAFEIVLARRVAAGAERTEWFARHGSTPRTDLPAHWPPAYRALVERRIATIEQNRFIRLLEAPEYKRRWSTAPWPEREREALRGWMLDTIEALPVWQAAPQQAVTVGALAAALEADAAFGDVAARYTGTLAFDVEALVRDLVTAEAAPALPGDRFKPSGLRKFARWEATWAAQRVEDTIMARTTLPEGHADRLNEADAKALVRQQVGRIPVPPDYTSADFKPGVWQVRGKLDVPRERFVALPVCDDADRGPALLWAGWDARQKATATIAWFRHSRDLRGASPEAQQRLLSVVADLQPWVAQWHEPDFAAAIEGFLAREAGRLGSTPEALWRERYEATPATKKPRRVK